MQQAHVLEVNIVSSDAIYFLLDLMGYVLACWKFLFIAKPNTHTCIFSLGLDPEKSDQ